MLHDRVASTRYSSVHVQEKRNREGTRSVQKHQYACGEYEEAAEVCDTTTGAYCAAPVALSVTFWIGIVQVVVGLWVIGVAKATAPGGGIWGQGELEGGCEPQ